eukprot:5212760-Alexandrium_andersonii.AAC.1
MPSALKQQSMSPLLGGGVFGSSLGVFGREVLDDAYTECRSTRVANRTDRTEQRQYYLNMLKSLQ